MLVLLVCLWVVSPLQAMQVLYQWKTLDFAFPDAQTRAMYNASTTFPLDVDTWPQDPRAERVFVTVPRFYPGVPATLTTIVASPNGQPVLEAYPNWEMNKQGNCDGITSVLRVKVDECGRLWVLDTGVVENMTPNSRQICQPQLLVFNLRNDELIWQYRIPSHNLVATSLLGTVAVDIKGTCDNVYAYLADITGYGLVVVDPIRETSWRYTGNYFRNSPSATHFNINGAEFDLPDGVISLAISPPRGSSRILYFHSLAGTNENSVNTEQLKVSGSTLTVDEAPVPYSGQSGPAAMAGPILFYSNLPDNSLNCWNFNRPYTSNNLVKVYKDDVKFQFPSGLKAINHSGQNWIYALTSRFQNVMVGRVNENDVNYRIMAAPVSWLVSGTNCE